MPDGVLLLVKTHAFGDALMCTPSARELAEGENELWVLTGPSAAPVWERLEGIRRVFVAPVPPAGAGGMLRLLSWTLGNRSVLSKVQSSMVFQGSPGIRRWVRFLTSAPSRSCGGSSLGKWEEVFPMEDYRLAGSSFAKVAGVEPSDWRPEFIVRREERDWVEGLGLPMPLFAIAPGGGSNPRDTVMEKRWAPERFAVIAERIAASGCSIVMLGGGEDREVAARVQSMCGKPLLDLTGKTTWGQTAAVLDMCCGFLGADSGTAHLSTARGLPSVVLFGPSSHSSLYSKGLVIPVSGEVQCSPCYSNSLFPGCSHDRAICMDAIETEEVWQAVVIALGGGAEP